MGRMRKSIIKGVLIMFCVAALQFSLGGMSMPRPADIAAQRFDAPPRPLGAGDAWERYYTMDAPRDPPCGHARAIPAGLCAAPAVACAAALRLGRDTYGVGLGLTMARRTVAAMGGHIEVASVWGEGTTVRFTLQRVAALQRRPHPTPKPSRAPSIVKPRVLVVDDDRMIGRSIARALHDHEVVAVQSGQEALDLLVGDRDFDIILCDLMMPTMSGVTLHEHVRRLEPRLAEKFKFITGGAYTPETKTFVAENAPKVVSKPLMTADLRALVERQLSTQRR